MRCIYCRRSDEDVAFNREHVVPLALGTFHEHPVLHDAVCADCNQHFGDTIEREMARASPAAALRLQHGVKPPSKAKNLDHSAVTFSYRGGGDWNGVLLDLSDERDTVELVPQVGFVARDQSGTRFIRLDELERDEFMIPEDLDTERGIQLVIPEETRDRAINVLRAKGVNFIENRRDSPPMEHRESILVETSAVISTDFRRAVCKILLNYIAFQHGPELVLDPGFDDAREYVRHGTDGPSQIVSISGEPILFDDLPDRRQNRAHLAFCDWSDNKQAVIGALSLFNQLTYRVLAAPTFTGVWRPIQSGHLFDPGSREIHPLRFTQLVLPKRRF